MRVVDPETREEVPLFLTEELKAELKAHSEEGFCTHDKETELRRRPVGGGSVFTLRRSGWWANKTNPSARGFASLR